MKAYEVIVNYIVENLEKGNIPWQKPWRTSLGVPKNLTNKKAYRGINILLTAFRNFNSPWWLSFKQCEKLGGKVKKGEKGTPVVFWNWINVKKSTIKADENNKNEDQVNKAIPFIRYYTIFNVEQCEGLEKHIPEVEKLPEFNPINKCEDIILKAIEKPKIEHGGSRAYYSPGTDHIKLPEKKDFHGPEEYYCVLFHELAHSTGHEKRLNRPEVVNTATFGNHDYSKEELVAEITASFLCGYAGIENVTIDNSLAYIQSWVSTFQKKPKMIITASQQAQKAADYILGIKKIEK